MMMELEYNKKKSIWEKIYYIQSEIGNLFRNEKNIALNYNFFTENQVLSRLKPLLHKYKICLIYSDLKDEIKYELINGKFFVVSYWKKLIIKNIDEEKETESIELKYFAIGMNSDPAKAKGAADTYSIKYSLSKLFLIPVDDYLDPDRG